MDCNICKNKEICKWVSDMDRIKKIHRDTIISPESPVTLEVKCRRFQAEIKGAIRGETNCK